MIRISRRFASTSEWVTKSPKYYLPRHSLLKAASDALVKCGAERSHADLTADLLISSDERGIPSHGLNRLEVYCREMLQGVVNGKIVPEVQSSDGSTILVNGNNAMGSVVSKFCMEQGIARARELGVAAVSATNSNHFGIAGYWTAMAREENMIGWAMTTTSPIVVPTRGSQRSIGTNAFSCAVPSDSSVEKDEYLLDMATSQVPIGKVEVVHRQGIDMPPGWGVDKAGEQTTKPEDILDGGGLLPIAGVEETCGYKGYGLGLMVELLCGGLANSPMGHNVANWSPYRPNPINYSHFFLVLDPLRFNPNFHAHTNQFLNELRQQPPAPSAPGPVVIAGDIEKAQTQQHATMGIPLDKKVAGSVKWFIGTFLEVELPPEFDDVETVVAEWKGLGEAK